MYFRSAGTQATRMANLMDVAILEPEQAKSVPGETDTVRI